MMTPPTITDDDATPSLSIADVSGNETAGNRQFTVTLSAAAGRDVTVNYATLMARLQRQPTIRQPVAH